MKPLAFCVSCLIALASCSSPPRPPTVDEADKRPANAAVAVELQVCRGELQNTRLQALENARAAQANGSAVARLIQQQALAQAASQVSGATSATPPPGNTVHTLYFDFASAEVSLPVSVVRHLTDEARAAPLIVLRGRTDGTTDSPVEARVARQRAEAVRGLLLQAGLDPARIRTTWQPSGDQVVDNGSASGRALNRRVEVEIYRVAPQAVVLGPPASVDAAD